MQDTLRHQKEQMKEDRKWLEMEERLLVGNRASLTFVKPLSVSVCPSAHTFSVTPEAANNKACLKLTNPLLRAPNLNSLKLSVPQINVPQRGPVSIICQMNLPVLLQDPKGPEDVTDPAVGVHLKMLSFQSQDEGREILLVPERGEKFCNSFKI